MNYRQAVAEGRQLVRRSEEDLWTLAKLTAETVGAVRPDGSKVTHAMWATDIGISTSWSSQLKGVWTRYSIVRSNERPRFADAAASYTMGEETTQSEKAKKYYQGVVQVPERHGDKVEVARRLLAEPSVAQDVLQDQRTRATVAKASMQVASAQFREQRQEQERRAPDASRSKRIYDILGRLITARRQVVTTLDELRNIDLDDEQREQLLEVVEELENAIQWLGSYVRSGSRSFDKELDRLLTEG
jgi:hypothetical protein